MWAPLIIIVPSVVIFPPVTRALQQVRAHSRPTASRELFICLLFLVLMARPFVITILHYILRG